jgi:hypothetical protein
LHPTITCCAVRASDPTKLGRRLLCDTFVSGVNPHRDKTPEWWIPQLLSCGVLHPREPFIVMARREAHRWVLRLVGLKEDPTGPLSSARSPRDLRQQLERTFGCTKIGKTQRLICQDHAYQRDPRKIMPFGDHLGPHQNVERTFSKSTQDPVRFRTRGRISVEPTYPRRREGRREGIL